MIILITIITIMIKVDDAACARPASRPPAEEPGARRANVTRVSETIVKKIRNTNNNNNININIDNTKNNNNNNNRGPVSTHL